jgi:hypothetical protein
VATLRIDPDVQWLSRIDGRTEQAASAAISYQVWQRENLEENEMTQDYDRAWNNALERAAKVAREHKSGPEYGRPHIIAQNETCDQIAKRILTQRRSLRGSGPSGPTGAQVGS